MPATEDENPEQQAQRREVEKICADIGRVIGRAVSEASVSARRRLGFTFLMFDFGAAGSMVYLSNANREDMIRMLMEAVQKLKEHTQ